MSTKTSTARTRRDRIEAVKAEQRRHDRRLTLIVVIAAATIGLVLIGGSVWAVSQRSDSATAASGQGGIPGLQTYSGLARDHVNGAVTYAQTPPAGGQHSSAWQNCGVYTAPVANENAVHSLEHGAMWITYQPDLPQSQVDLIKADAASQPYALVSPYPGLPAPVVATVWGAQLKLDSANDPRLKTFINTYKSGTQAPEPGGECTGGVGIPSG